MQSTQSAVVVNFGLNPITSSPSRDPYFVMHSTLVVGRHVTPVVGMQVQEIIGGLGPGKRPEEVCAGERTGTIRKVIGRLSAQSEKSTTLSCGVVWEEGADMQVRLERTMCCCSAAAFVPDLARSPACPRDAIADVQAFWRGSTQLKKTGLGGNFELLLSPLDPSHPAHMRARSPPPALAAVCAQQPERGVRTRSSTSERTSKSFHQSLKL